MQDNFWIMINYKFVFKKYISIFPLWKSNDFFLFSKKVQYWKQSTNTANIVPLSPNQIADIFSC